MSQNPSVSDGAQMHAAPNASVSNALPTENDQDLQTLDACNLDCPLPLLKAKLALNKMAAGQLLQVLATDSGSQRDFAAFAKQSGHELLESTESEGVFRYLMRKAS